MRKRNLFSALLGIVLLVPTVSQARDVVTYDEQWVYQGLTDAGSVGYVKQIAPELRYVSNSILMNSPKDSSGKILPVNACTSTLDKNCTLTDFQNYYALLPQCHAATDTDCISQVAASIDGKSLAIKALGQFPSFDSQSFIGDPSLNLPSGSTSTLVVIPEAPHPGGDFYVIKVQMYGARR